MATPSQIFTEMVTTTDRDWSRKLADNVSRNNAFLYRLNTKGNIQTITGGYEIAQELEYAENSTYQNYSGYDRLNTNASDVLTAARYEMEQAAIHVTASGKEIRQNRAKERMMNLVKARKKNAIHTAENRFSIDLYSDGTVPNQIGGLAHIIQEGGQGTVGGIDASVFTFWRNKVREIAGTGTPSYTNLRNGMNALWYSLKRGMDQTDLILSTQDLYGIYEGGLQDNQRYMDSKMASAGFESLMYKTAPIIFDDNTNFTVAGEKQYFINSDYLMLKQHQEAKWTPDDPKRPTDQDAIVIPYYWMGNLCCSNRSLQGVLINNT